MKSLSFSLFMLLTAQLAVSCKFFEEEHKAESDFQPQQSSQASAEAKEEQTTPDLLEKRPETALKLFEDPQEKCRECHPQHVEEWEISNHAYAAVDPVFVAMVKVGQRQTEGKLDQFCVQCHTPPGMLNNFTTVEKTEEGYKQNLDLDPVSKQGVSCDTCHSITLVMEPQNARVVYSPDGNKRSTIKDPVETEAHESSYSPLHEKSEVCAACHNVVNPAGAKLEETFTEWEKSSFNKPEGGKTCQDCHMPEYEGYASEGEEKVPKRTLHRHFFVGVDVSLLPKDEFPGYEKMRELTRKLLQESAELDVSYDGDSKRITFAIKNLSGHALPSGATAERQMWIEMKIYNDDISDQPVYVTGTLDENGDLRDENPKHNTQPGSDPDLIVYKQKLFSVKGSRKVEDEVMFPWQAKDLSNNIIPADGTDKPSIDLPAGLTSGNYRAEVRLLFRTFPPYFLRELEKLGGLDPAVKERLPIVEMETAELEFTVD